MYQSKSYTWKGGGAYFRDDGTMVAYSTHQGKLIFSDGTWRATGNNVCLHYYWRGEDKDAKPFNQESCKAHYRSGKQIWIHIYKDLPQWQGTIYAEDNKNFRDGDIISAKTKSIKQRYGY
ncbi:MAG: hypothetical protein BroJett030_08630 [Alphaproteobacteria bacterium]|nr:MAG: hypothetical protein BroJett030_08630 [Alphaproteobacteria bacterium]